MMFLTFAALVSLPFWITPVVMGITYLVGALLGAVGAIGKVLK